MSSFDSASSFVSLSPDNDKSRRLKSQRIREGEWLKSWMECISIQILLSSTVVTLPKTRLLSL